MMRLVGLAAIIACALTANGRAQTAPPPLHVFWNIQYVRGDRPWKCGQCRGSIVIEADSLRVASDWIYAKGRIPKKTVFSIPFDEIVDIASSTTREDEYAAGYLKPTTTNKEFVTITTETPAATGALVFSVPLHSSVDMIAKIKFAMKHAQDQTPK